MKFLLSSRYIRYILGVLGVVGLIFLGVQYIQYQERQRIELQNELRELRDYLTTRERIDEGVRDVGPNEQSAREWLLRRQQNRE